MSDRKLSTESLKIESIYALSDCNNLTFGSSKHEINIIEAYIPQM